ncbi:hypothetical protein [Lysinibacillus odysseyi]|uniref:Uncharacterized protein n=1 Tax=Lysinibacillus odysseyi 34hs-1 = NBRC 100172 TaxID=1220589 RepID=A0A0A3IXR2_9BACI|nr:hypothetical protein [Lysinibacillus odysseyi]KGR89501.1 hypothetical protein CD32_00285 [Lysinibacillus odysseyi 34hs-1 = NBRC 100172]
MIIEKEIIDRICSIDWFSNCGNSCGISTQLTIVEEVNWKKAMKHSQSRYWEEITLEASNELTEFLAVNAPAKYKEWNKIVREGKGIIEKSVVPEITEYLNRQGLSHTILDNVKWDIISAIMEHTYRMEKEPFFFLELLKVYEAGNFPCGWRGSWPNGKLIVY